MRPGILRATPRFAPIGRAARSAPASFGGAIDGAERIEAHLASVIRDLTTRSPNPGGLKS
jgi:hypothetical protein